jgi:hypothetical protein
MPLYDKYLQAFNLQGELHDILGDDHHEVSDDVPFLHRAGADKCI